MELCIAGGQSNMEYYLRYDEDWEKIKKLPLNTNIHMYNCPRLAFKGHVKDISEPKEHNPAHFHANYNDYIAIIDINKCELIDGSLPNKQLKLVLAWAEIHKDELIANWNLAMNSELPFKVDPLK